MSDLAFAEATAGWLAGAAVGNLLFPTQGPESRVEGPRLGDLIVTSSTYGAPIAIGYGPLRMAGNLIWSSSISEARNVSRSRAGGKGGGGAALATTRAQGARVSESRDVVGVTDTGIAVIGPNGRAVASSVVPHLRRPGTEAPNASSLAALKVAGAEISSALLLRAAAPAATTRARRWRARRGS